MGKLIELDEVMEILTNWEAITYNCNTIEESFAMLANEVNSLPQIDIEETIKEMIDSGKGWNSDNSWNYLEELLQKFKS